MEQLKLLNRQLRIQDVLSVLITQSTKLIEIVNANQKEVNRLKKELYLNKLLDSTRIILYTWQVAGDGG